MTNTKLLKNKIKQSGLKRSYLAIELGLSVYGLANKISNKTEFKTSEVNILCRILKINSLSEKEQIFFANKVD